MGVDYDAWLEKPYQDMAEAEALYEQAEEKYLESDSYQEHFSEWLEEEGNAGKTEQDFQKSSEYEKGVESVMESLSEPNYDDYYDRDRDDDRRYNWGIWGS